MAPSGLQNGGFVLGLLGSAALIAATAMGRWSVKDLTGDLITSMYTYRGLWKDCETTGAGMTECRPLYGMLEYTGTFQAVRALMIVGVVLSVLATLLSLFSLQCLSMNKMQDSTKAKMSLTAGIMFISAGKGKFCLASVYANQIVSSSMGVGIPTYDIYKTFQMRFYTFGPALFVAWIGGIVLLVGGILKSVAFREMVKNDKPRYPGVVYKPQSHAHTDDHHTDGGNKYV
uniref:Claudin n=1 Tax=Neogobius melanostomus TaxID=47308 RepID=A0A8C6WWZ4_9GOBI